MTEKLYFCDSAWIDGGPVARVALAVADGKITRVESGAERTSEMQHLPGLTVPGMANCHTHTFHRALRGALGTGTDFWTWRDTMYRIAANLDPDTYFRFAEAAYTEMALAGFTTVAEFHYVHAEAGGASASNEFGLALKAAAASVGIRLTLLDTCYLSSGFGAPVAGAQLQFTDGSAKAWRQRVEQLPTDDLFKVGAAVHSVRAVPEAEMRVVADWAEAAAAPLHVHFSEQQREVDDCIAKTRCTPTELLDRAGVWGPRTTGVHGVYVTPSDVATIAKNESMVCVCPSTEADLADGIAPFGDYIKAGVPLVIGTDENVVTDPFGELRRIDEGERWRTGARDHISTPMLMTAASRNGQRSAGWSQAGQLAVGALADFVTVRTDALQIAGVAQPRIPEFLTANDVTGVYVAGNQIVAGRESAATTAAATLAEIAEQLRSAK